MFELNESWQTAVGAEFQKDYMLSLSAFLKAERVAGKSIYPAERDVFAALNHTPVDKVKVVILGQDPYHGPNQAHGLSFSVPHGVPAPPSLVNIYKEMETDLGLAPARHGCLQTWARKACCCLTRC